LVLGELNPILALLCKNRRYLREDDVASILAAIHSFGDSPFRLGDLDRFIPEVLRANNKARRSISALLEELARLGYLSKPSERKYQKRYPSLSHMLSDALFELSEIEKRQARKPPPERIIRLDGKPRRVDASPHGGAKTS